MSFALLSGVCSAAVIQVDFGTSTSAVEPGFVAQTSGAATPYSTPQGSITVGSTGSFFNRSASGTYTSAPLLGDFTFLNSFGTLTLTIGGAGIASNTAYEIQFWSYDSQHGTGGGTVTYTGVNGTLGATSIAYSSSNLGSGDSNSSTAFFTSNGSGDIVIDVTGTNEGPRVNGLAITVIPEPSSAILLGVASALVVLRRRR